MKNLEEWIAHCDTALASFIKKKTNQHAVARALWKCANRDVTQAKYLMFEIYADYCANPKLKDIFSRLQHNQVGWNHPELAPIIHRFAEVDTFLTDPPQVDEGVIQCNKCGSKRTFSFSKQTRRADESATVFVRCAQCHATFRL